MGWQPEHDELLRILLTSGRSCAEAAAAINSRHQTSYSRQACIGRSNRIGLAQSLQRKPWGESKTKEANKRKAQQRKAKRWADNPSLAERARKIAERKANRKMMLAGGATKTSPAYRNHLPRLGEKSKSELRAMLTAAVQNTAALGASA